MSKNSIEVELYYMAAEQGELESGEINASWSQCLATIRNVMRESIGDQDVVIPDKLRDELETALTKHEVKVEKFAYTEGFKEGVRVGSGVRRILDGEE